MECPFQDYAESNRSMWPLDHGLARNTRHNPALGRRPENIHKLRKNLHLSNSRCSNHLPSRPVFSPPPSAGPPDTMWLREGFARAISPRGKGFRTHLSGSPLVNSFGFNKALRISRTCMSGMGSLRKKSPKNPRLDRHGLGRPPAGLRRHRQQMLRRSGAVPEADEGDPLPRETRLVLARLLPAPRRHQPRPTDGTIHRYEEFGDACFRLSSLARISPDYYREIAVRPGACALTAGRAS